MSAYREFSGKSVEEAIRLARDEFGVGLDGLDFEILTPGSRGVLGMGAEPFHKPTQEFARLIDSVVGMDADRGIHPVVLSHDLHRAE